MAFDSFTHDSFEIGRIDDQVVELSEEDIDNVSGGAIVVVGGLVLLFAAVAAVAVYAGYEANRQETPPDCVKPA